jgi:hypothetical protein
MRGSEEVGTTLDRDMILEIVEREDWREIRKYLKELKRDLSEGFEKLNECLSCPPNAMFCSEVGRLVESYNRALLAVLMLRCFLGEALGVVENEKIRKRLTEVLEVTDDIVLFLNQKHGLIHQLVDKCRSYLGDGS